MAADATSLLVLWDVVCSLLVHNVRVGPGESHRLCVAVGDLTGVQVQGAAG